MLPWGWGRSMCPWCPFLFRIIDIGFIDCSVLVNNMKVKHRKQNLQELSTLELYNRRLVHNFVLGVVSEVEAVGGCP